MGARDLAESKWAAPTTSGGLEDICHHAGSRQRLAHLRQKIAAQSTMSYSVGSGAGGGGSTLPLASPQTAAGAGGGGRQTALA